MSNHISGIRDAIAAAISADVSLDLTASAVYSPIYDVSNTEGIVCMVCPKYAQIMMDSRSTDSQVYTMDVAILKKVNNLSTDVTALIGKLSEIYRKFRGVRLSGYTSAAYVGAVMTPIYDPTRLEKENVFLGVLSLQYRIVD